MFQTNFIFQTKKYMLSAATIFLLLVSMILTACGGAGSVKKDTAQNDKPIEITDVTGQKVTLKKPAERVVVQWSASGGAFLTMAALTGKNVTNLIVGIDPSLSKYRTDMWNHFKADLPELEKIPLIGAVNEKTFDTEKVVSLNPDVIFIPLYMKEPYESDVKPKLDAAGIPTVYIDYHAEKLENHQRSIEAIGKALGKEERAAELKQFYTDHVTKVTDRINKISKPKPKVYIETGNEGPEGAGVAYSSKVAWGPWQRSAAPILLQKMLLSRRDRLIPNSFWKRIPTSL